MERHSVEAIVAALNVANVRYLIAGGLAVVAHGHVRFTADIDLMLSLEPDNVGRAIEALSRLGYQPRVPVPFTAFADAEQRALWARERQMTVFSVYSAQHPATEVDIFAQAPIDFEGAYASRRLMPVAPGVIASFVGLADLLEMKRKAGRHQDNVDIEALTALARDVNDGEPNEQ
jgi:hypothetical protein